jgi:hypothetical protein
MIPATPQTTTFTNTSVVGIGDPGPALHAPRELAPTMPVTTSRPITRNVLPNRVADLELCAHLPQLRRFDRLRF